MSQCFCCLKEISKPLDPYHPQCLKKLFGVSWVPKIPFSISDLPAQVIKLGGKMSLSGVQMKVSVRLNLEQREMVVCNLGGTYILKPEPNEFPELPQNENLCMNIAAMVGFNVPPQGLFSMSDSKYCYIVKRFDRLENGEKVQMENAAQILQLEDKYKGSLELIGKVIRRHVTNSGLDAIEFFERVLLCFLIGNGDMHLKNWSLLILGANEINLAPCYDFVSSKIYIPNEEESALTLNGKRNHLKRKDFESLALGLEIDPKVLQNLFKKYRDSKDALLQMIEQSRLSAKRREQMKQLVLERYHKLFEDSPHIEY